MPIMVPDSSTAFATPEDVAVRLGRTFTPDETAQLTALLDDASQMIRDFCRQDISAQTGLTMTVESPDGPWLVIPQRPVTNVSSVSVNGEQVGDWSKVGDRLYRVFGWRWPSVDMVPPMAIYGLMSTVTVVYDAGYATVPPIIATICRNAAMRSFDNPFGLFRESTTDYTREYPRAVSSVGSDQQVGVFLTDTEQKRLRRYRRGAGAIDVTVRTHMGESL